MSSCAVGGLCIVGFGCAVSSSVDGAALGLHIFCGVRSCSFGLVVDVDVAGCGDELCRGGVVFVVSRCVGVTFLRNLVSPVQSPTSSFFVVLVWKVVWCSLVVVLVLALVCG